MVGQSNTRRTCSNKVRDRPRHGRTLVHLLRSQLKRPSKQRKRDHKRQPRLVMWAQNALSTLSSAQGARSRPRRRNLRQAKFLEAKRARPPNHPLREATQPPLPSLQAREVQRVKHRPQSPSKHQPLPRELLLTLQSRTSSPSDQGEKSELADSQNLAKR